MPSANPDLTQHMRLPSPLATDPPDVPGDIKALAEAIDNYWSSTVWTDTTAPPAPWQGRTTYRKVGPIVFLLLQWYRPSTALAAGDFVTLPAELRPSSTITFVAATYKGDRDNPNEPHSVHMQLNTQGVVAALTPVRGPNGTQLWISGTVSYPVAP